MVEIVVLRWGHRPMRDSRLTSHVALTARALGASGLVLSDIKDQKIEETIEKVNRSWGGSFFVKMGVPWKKFVKEWRKERGIVVHLTVYGENIEKSNVLKRIKSLNRDILVIVGSQKVPREFCSPSVSNFNVAIGNQPHSECTSLAIFLDRFFQGRELTKKFEDARVKIVPQKRGKKVVSE